MYCSLARGKDAQVAGILKITRLELLHILLVLREHPGTVKKKLGGINIRSAMCHFQVGLKALVKAIKMEINYFNCTATVRVVKLV